jgi:hypothetical protein
MPRKKAIKKLRKNKRRLVKKHLPAVSQTANEEQMYKTPMIFPLDPEGKIYILQDENGNTIGTGTRKVCEVLLYIITNAAGAAPEASGANIPQRSNVRAAITI